jgi:hypothetical protein
MLILMARHTPLGRRDVMVRACIMRTCGRNVSDGYLEKGEEVYLSYGPYPNDFLLVECRYPVS